MKWTSDKNFGELYDLAVEDKCDKNCEHCPLFIEKRKECFLQFDKKHKEWARKQSLAFQERMKNDKNG